MNKIVPIIMLIMAIFGLIVSLIAFVLSIVAGFVFIVSLAALVFLIVGIFFNATPFVLGLAFRGKLSKASFVISLIGLVFIFIGFILLFAL